MEEKSDNGGNSALGGWRLDRESNDLARVKISGRPSLSRIPDPSDCRHPKTKSHESISN